jgi:hypothetical protein
VRQNNQNAGVAEVGRLKANEIVWEKTRDSVLGLSFLKSKAFESEIGPGIYRIEVSTPDNVGKYMLTIGEERVSSGEVYTRPEILEYKGKKYKVPKILLSGNHAEIEKWKLGK